MRDLQETMLPFGVQLLDVVSHDDARGRLFAFEQSQRLPFTPVRSFLIFDVPVGQVRAGHAVSCHEFLWMVAGGCVISLDDGELQCSIALQPRALGLFVPSGIRIELRDFDPDAILMVLASQEFAKTRYFAEPQRDLLAAHRRDR